MTTGVAILIIWLAVIALLGWFVWLDHKRKLTRAREQAMASFSGAVSTMNIDRRIARLEAIARDLESIQEARKREIVGRCDQCGRPSAEGHYHYCPKAPEQASSLDEHFETVPQDAPAPSVFGVDGFYVGPEWLGSPVYNPTKERSPE
jgi:hypothetical protein